jgi:O-antigen/teichoic acid export membrane protein
MTVTAIISNFGTAPALVQRLPTRDGIDEWSRALSASLLGGAAFGGLAGLLVLAVIPVFSHRLSVASSDPVLALLFVGGTGLWTVSIVLDYAFIAERHSRSMSLRGALFAIVKIPLLAAPALAFSGGGGIRAIMGSWVGACAISCVIGVFVMVPAIRPGFRLRGRGIVAELRESSRLLVGNYLITLGNTLPLYVLPVIVVSRLSATANAYFYVTWMVGGIFFMISSSTGSSLFAEGSNHPDRIGTALRSSIRLTALLLLPAMLFAFLAGGLILRAFGAAYAAHGTHLLWVLTIAAIFDAITNLYVPVLRVRHRLRAAGLLTMSMALGAIIGAWIVAPSMGLVGIGVVWCAGQALGSAWVAWDCGALARISRRIAPGRQAVGVGRP